jgi:stearoyl-CoA desaturase (delta-9 desaturase)
MYIRILESLGLAEVKKIAPRPRFDASRPSIDQQTLNAVITHRYDVLAKYAKSLKTAYREEVGRLRGFAPHEARMLQQLKRWLHRDEQSLHESERTQLTQTLAKHRALHTLYTMRSELTALWERSTVSSEQLVKHLQDWCQRADASGIAPLQEFSQRLRCYA